MILAGLSGIHQQCFSLMNGSSSEKGKSFEYRVMGRALVYVKIELYWP